VTFYGIIDANSSTTKVQRSDVGDTNIGGAAGAVAMPANSKSTGVQAVDDPVASSRFGFRGTEDLGGGTSAIFNVELDMTTGGGEAISPNNARTSTVGLSDKSMGTINVGRQLTGVHGVVAGFNPLAGNNMVGDILYSGAFRAHSVSNLNANFAAQSAAFGATSVGNTTGTLNPVNTIGVDSVRMNRGISYVSPVFNGFTARIDYAQDKVNGNTDATGNNAVGSSVKHQGLTVNYAQGPIRAAASTHTAKADPSIATGAANQAVQELKINAVSAAYQLTPAISLQASHAASEFSTAGALSTKTKGTRLGANYNVGKWVLAAQYGTGDVSTPAADVATLNAVAGTYGVGTAADRTAYQLAAFYNLSKRTALYAAYGSQEQKITAANARLTVTTADDRASAVGDKTKYSQMAVGVRHSF
jgi:predicted porin